MSARGVHKQTKRLIGQIKTHIEQTGWSVIATPTPSGSFLGYTVGLTMWRLPELCTYGVTHNEVHALLNELAERQRTAGEFDHGQLTTFRCQVFRLERMDDLGPLSCARMFFADDYPAAPRALLVTPFDGGFVRDSSRAEDSPDHSVVHCEKDCTLC